MEAGVEQGGELVEFALRQDERHVAGRFVLADQLVLRQEIAPLLVALPKPHAILMPVVGEQRVVSGSAQIAAQATQHFIAEEAGGCIHGAMLCQLALLRPASILSIMRTSSRHRTTMQRILL